MPQVGELTIFCGAMVGASIGFLWYNAHPAEIFMGDVGSLALGGAIGTVAVIIKQELLLPFIGGIFVIEALSVILQVASFKLRRKRIFKMAPAAPSLRAAGMVGVEDHRALLDRFAGICTLCTDHAEVALARSWWFVVEVSMSAQKLDVKDKRVLVVGLGKSGVASAIFLKDRGARVSVSDAKTEDQLRSAIPALLDKGISVETGGHGERTFRDQDLIVVSPGVPSDVPQLEKARAQGIPIIGEVELASRFLKGHIIAITGSNGKTTTTALAGEVIAMGGYEVLVGGNIGTPAIALVADSTSDTYNVLEISSFQLESIESFHPEIAVVLNITPDHLDRHHSFDAYVLAKARIFENQTAQDCAVLNADDPTCARSGCENPRSGVPGSAASRKSSAGRSCATAKIFWRDDERRPGDHAGQRHHAQGRTQPGKRPGRGLRRTHRRLRAAPHPPRRRGVQGGRASAGVRHYHPGRRVLQRFQGHQRRRHHQGSGAFPGNIHIILGGKDKGSDYSVLKDLLRARAKRVYTIGAAAEKIESQIAGAVPVLRAETLETAVKRAAESAAPGRHRAAGPGLRQLRSVRKLRAPWPRVQRGSAGSGRAQDAQRSRRGGVKLCHRDTETQR